MPKTARQFYWSLQGRTRLNFNWDEIKRDSVVLIAASEYSIGPDHRYPQPSGPRVVAEANISVNNIAPHGPPDDPNNGVTFVLDVNWPEPLHVVADITVLDGPPDVVEVQGPG